MGPLPVRVLLALHSLYRQEDCYVWTHRCIIDEAGSPPIPRGQMRAALKVLRTHGYAHHTIAWNMDEALVKGSGHYITHQGITYLQKQGLI